MTPLFESPDEQLDLEQCAVVWWLVMFTTLFQTLHSLPQRAVQWLLKFLSCLLKVLGHFSPKILSISQAFPGTIFFAIKIP